MKAQMGDTVIDLPIDNIDASREWAVSASLLPLYRRESDPVPILQEAGWDSKPAWKCMENLIPWPFELGTVQPLAIYYTCCVIPAYNKNNNNNNHIIMVIINFILYMPLYCWTCVQKNIYKNTQNTHKHIHTWITTTGLPMVWRIMLQSLSDRRWSKCAELPPVLSSTL